MAEQPEPVYHLELRRWPHAMTRFNLDGREVGAIVLPWVQERVIELEDQKWSPHEATITIIEGPPIPLEGLSMGRGWATALHDGQDVTERVLAEAREALASGEAISEMAPGAAQPQAPVPAPPTQAGAEAGQGADGDQLALGVELGALLGPDPLALLAAWRAVAARTEGLRPSESLALAEREADASGRGS